MRHGRALGQHQSSRRWARGRIPASHERDTGIDIGRYARFRTIGNRYARIMLPSRSGLQAPASEVYLHEMPGGQFTNLKAQARSLGLEERWPEVAQTYSDVNHMFGDIVKVTPVSKVVGDMALMMVSQGLTRSRWKTPRMTWPSPTASST